MDRWRRVPLASGFRIVTITRTHFYRKLTREQRESLARDLLDAWKVGLPVPVHHVAYVHGLPSSTLRTWIAKLIDDGFLGEEWFTRLGGYRPQGTVNPDPEPVSDLPQLVDVSEPTLVKLPCGHTAWLWIVEEP